LSCAACAIATDATLAGYPAVARLTGETSISVLEAHFSGHFVQVSSQAAIEAQLLAAGHGARGVGGTCVQCRLSRWHNSFPRRTNRGAASFRGYRSLSFMRTN